MNSLLVLILSAIAMCSAGKIGMFYPSSPSFLELKVLKTTDNATSINNTSVKIETPNNVSANFSSALNVTNATANSTNKNKTMMETAASSVRIYKYRGSCDCALYDMKIPKDFSKPILSHSPFNTTCDAIGEKLCFESCVGMKMEHCPSMICAELKHAENIKPRLFVRTCNNNWVYSGFSSKHAICCHENVVVHCNQPK